MAPGPARRLGSLPPDRRTQHSAPHTRHAPGGAEGRLAQQVMPAFNPAAHVEFLDFVAKDRLYMLWRLIAFTGTRRGEACGVRWEDHSAKARSLAIAT